MRISREGKMFLAGLEGISLSKYLDSVGVWTIGLGATRTEIPDIAKMPLNKSISIEEAFELLDKSIVKYENAVNKALSVNIEQNQFDALVSICYNIGTGGLSKSTFMRRINSKASMGKTPSSLLPIMQGLNLEDRTDRSIVQEESNWWGANSPSIVDAIMMWNKPSEIKGRRTKEATLYSTGKYAGNCQALLFPVSASGKPLYRQAQTINLADYI